MCQVLLIFFFKLPMMRHNLPLAEAQNECVQGEFPGLLLMYNPKELAKKVSFGFIVIFICPRSPCKLMFQNGVVTTDVNYSSLS